MNQMYELSNIATGVIAFFGILFVAYICVKVFTMAIVRGYFQALKKGKNHENKKKY